jgi:preprotein translocase subunit SecG
LQTAIDIAQILVAVGVILIILSQSRGTGLGSAFGGDSGSIYHTRRGIEKTLFKFTIGAVVVFVTLSIVATVFFG